MIDRPAEQQARLWTRERRDFNSDLIYEHTKGSTRVLFGRACSNRRLMRTRL